MGTNILKRTLSKDSFLIKNLKQSINSVFPPTTTAATTSIITALNPNQHCWLGWENYIKEIDQVVVMFLNNIKDTKIPAGKEKLSSEYFNYETIISKINQNSKYQATYISPFSQVKYKDFSDMCEKIRNHALKKKKIYLCLL